MKPDLNLRLLLRAAVLGGVVAVAGIALLDLIHLITNLSFFGEWSFHERDADFSVLGAWGILVPAAGGLIIGLLARYGSPAIQGHGIPEAMQGVMMQKSKIPLKIAILKPLSTALSIGTGGPFGAEGPIIATGGGIGSLFGQFLPSSSTERKILLAAGAAAGMTAVFGTPLAGVLLAIELLLFEFRGRSILPVAIAAGVAMGVRGLYHEPFPMLPLPVDDAPGPVLMMGSVIIGCVAGAAAVGMTHSLHAIEKGFEKLPIHWMWWPALGGLAVGLLAWYDPRVLGAGYYNLRALLDGHLTVMAIVTLGVFKFLAWSIYLGSGTAGGTLAPVMTIGGAVGALTAYALLWIPGFEDFPLGIAALVGMAAIFAGASRAFLTSVAFSFEATHSSAAFGPLLLGCACAVMVSRLLMKESIMTEKLARKGVRVPADYEPDSFSSCNVASVMLKNPVTIPPKMTVNELAKKITGPDEKWGRIRLFPIVSEENILLGIICRADVLEALRSSPDAAVIDAGVERPLVVKPHQILSDAADIMLKHSIGRLPVVSDDPEPRLLGLISRRELLLARKHRLEE